MIDALNYLASKIENGELLAETDPVQFLRSTADKIEQMETEVERLKGKLEEVSHTRKCPPGLPRNTEDCPPHTKWRCKGSSHDKCWQKYIDEGSES